MKNKRLLFIGNTRLGDCVLSTGLLEDVCKYYNAKATVICGSLGATIFKKFPSVDKVIILRKKKYSYHWFELWKEIRSTYWDVVCDLRGTPVSWCIRTKKRIILSKRKNITEHRINGLAKLNPLNRSPMPKIWLNESIKNEGKKLLQGRSKPFLVIGPTANWEAKIWPTNNFINLAKKLIESSYFKGGTLVIVGGPGEEEIGKNIMSQAAKINPINLIGEPILPTAAIFSFSRLYIGNDSGLMHLAAAIGAPTLGLFGPTDDQIYSPLGRNTMVVRTPETPKELMSTSDFDHRTSGSLMETLSIEKVKKITYTMLKKTSFMD